MEAWCFLLFSTGLIISTSSSPTVGPFDALLTDLSHCPETSKGIDYEHKLLRVSRKKLVISANVSFDVPFDDELDVSINLAKQTNQGWKENFFILEIPKACTAMKEYVPELERDLAKQLNTKHCPYPMGNYTVELPLQIVVKAFPVFPYGKYLTKVNVMKQHKRIFCIHGFFNITPKKSG